MTTLLHLGGERVLLCDADGPPIDREERALDLIGDAHAQDATLVAVPAQRLGGGFFQLRTGLAGAVAQKFVTYGFRLAVLGDIGEHLAASGALRDWVRESNRQGQILFVSGLDDLAARLTSGSPPP